MAIDCFCRTEKAEIILGNDNIRQLCKAYIGAAFSRLFLNILVILLTFFSNLFLRSFIKYMVRYTRPNSVSSEILAAGRKIFAAMFCNFIVQNLLLRLDFNGFKMGSYFLQFFSPVRDVSITFYPEFNKQWYSGVLVQIIIATFLETFKPHSFLLAHACIKLHCRKKQNSVQGRTLTQHDMNANLASLNFDFGYYHAKCLLMVYIVAVFSSGAPILYVVCLLFFVIKLNVDRIHLISNCKKPPFFNDKMMQFSLKAL